MNNLLKAVCVVTYVATLLSLFLPVLAPYSQILLIISGVLLVIHLGEYFLVRNRLSNVTGNHFIQTLLFGFLYWMPILRRQAQR